MATGLANEREPRLERRFAVLIVPNFARVLGVVAADTKDTPDRKNASPRDRNRSNRWRGDDEINHSVTPSFLCVKASAVAAGQEVALLCHFLPN
ncbi:MAG TPA: hypothetical protein VLQ90_11335, partial [Pyrinomonadaceae bacterium]|nr:hypothetical protein [Pyrinomonadaceae bacterium]